MRDVSLWSGDYLTSARYINATLRRRFPNFNWRSGKTYYSISTLGETWGDSPGTVIEERPRGLMARRYYGGFPVMADSETLSGGNILRVTSLRAGNQGDDMLYKEVSSSSSLTSMSTLTMGDPATAWTGIGLARHSTANTARLFYVCSEKLYYRDYTSGVGWGFITIYSGSPSFGEAGIAIAPITHDDGFVQTYDTTTHKITLHRFSSGSWSNQTMPMRYSQHIVNTHWFDAVLLSGSTYLITFCVNGIQYATIYDSNGFRDPWPVIAFTAEYGGVQTRICKLTKVGTRVIATAWSRFAGSSDDYDVSYYHLMWTDDGINWAMPEDGFIGRTASRGKLHTKGNYAYILGASVSYVGDAVTWLGGTVGTQNVAVAATSHNIVYDIDQTADMKLSLSLPSGFDKSLIEQGNELVYQFGLDGEGAIDMATLTMDTPAHGVDGYSESVEMICRGPIKKLISFTAPLDQTIDTAQAYYFDFEQGGIYARKGIWSHDSNSGVAYSERSEQSDALATIGIQYKGQFQISTRMRITEAIDGSVMGIVFWYEGLQDHYRLDIEESNGKMLLRKIKAGQTTLLVSTDITPVADTWYDVLVRYTGGTLYAYIREVGGGDGWNFALSYSDWDEPEPTTWYAGLFCSIPTTTTTQELEFDATHKVTVNSTDGFPSSGEIKIDNEIVSYSSKTATQFGAGTIHSIVRGVRSTRASHPVGGIVSVAGRRFESDFFVVIQDDRPMSVGDACAYIGTLCGVSTQNITLVDDINTGIRVFPQLHGHSWVLSGEYSGGSLTLYFWTDTNNPPQSGYKVEITQSSGGRAILSNVAASVVERQPVTIPSSGTFKCRVEKNTILFWVNDQFLCGFVIPGDRTHRVGSVAVGDDVSRIVAKELFSAAEGIVWSMKESARDVLSRLLEGRDVHLRERSDGSIQVTLLENRDDLGTMTGSYVLTYQRAGADDEWASAMVAWGAEDWVMLSVPNADRLRWTQWQTPHIYDKETLRNQAMRRLRKLWARKNVRSVSGPLDPRIEVGDEITVSSIRGIASGKYFVRSIEIKGDDKIVDMQLTLQGLPDELTVATWPIIPGVDIPTEGTY